ncbi:MAG: M66 family metalloprotease [Polyangiaceae bacterium]|nr:M66 family metalloprotease [Polyangiaceae bacterium]
MKTKRVASGLVWAIMCPGAAGCGAGDFPERENRAFAETAATVGVYQAEDFTSQSGCQKTAVHAGYTGTGFMDFGGNGSLVEWNNVNAPSAGKYTLVFRYANGASGTRQCAITVNDTTNAGNVQFGSTGAWASWSNNSIDVNLKQGNNKIRVMANTGSGGPNLDKMDLTSDGTAPTGGTCAQVKERSTATLSCPSGQVIKSITFASYGLPTGACPSFSQGTCHASTSQSKVESLCLNKQSCSVAASNDVFGDPCSGKNKTLAILYTCGAGGTPPPPPPTTTKSIDAVFFAQTHVQQPSDPYFNLVASRKTLIKAHIIGPGNPPAPTVKAILTLNNRSLTVPLTGPATLPASIPKAPGVVQHSLSNTFTGFIPPDWMKHGLSVVVQAGSEQVAFNDLSMGAPTKVVMNMFDAQYFQDTTGDYPAGWKDELEAKWPVSSIEVRRLPHVVFPELVIPARSGAPAVRVRSKDDYKAQTGLNFDGEQGAAAAWKGALKAAAGTSGRHSLYYVSIYGVGAGGQAGGFGGVGNGTSAGILCHELGHALGLGDCYGGGADYPYKGPMYGIPTPGAGSDIHVGPIWAYYLYNQAFIPPTVQRNSVGGTVGTYKKDPMCGGGQGDQEQGYIMRHFSDYSVHKMRSFLEGHVVVWNGSLNSYASWDSSTNSYTKQVTNNGVQFPITRDASVISVMASISGATRNVNMVYPAIGPYTAGLIKLFDPRDAAQRQEAASIYCPNNGCDLTFRVTQGGVQKYYMLAASWEPTADPLSGGSLQTKAVNLPASGGAVTRADLLLTPDAQNNGLPASPTVLYSWTK